MAIPVVAANRNDTRGALVHDTYTLYQAPRTDTGTEQLLYITTSLVCSLVLKLVALV
jgi:hypothetical protein